LKLFQEWGEEGKEKNGGRDEVKNEILDTL
jgi:hypothetical protein